MAPPARGPIAYRVGNENNPGNPFGRSELFIGIDGRARHILHTLGPTFAWSGVVAADAHERLWSALARAGFPECPMIMPPAGSTMRSLTIGYGSDAPSIYLPFHASVPGYDVAFSILDAVLCEMSEDMVKDAQARSIRLVADVARAEPPPPRAPEPVVDRPGLGAGAAFLLAYLPAHRIAHQAKLAHLETLVDPALAHARMFGGGALKISGSLISTIDERHAELTRAAGVGIGADVRSELTTPAAKAAWKAGETARAVTIAAELAAHVAYFRASAPDDASLRAQADEHAHALRTSAAQLASDLAATRCSLALRHKEDAARMVSLTGEGFAELAGLASDLGTFFGAMGHHLDDAARRVFEVVDARGIVRRPVRGWDELQPRVLTTMSADPSTAALAEGYALEACRRMAVWGWRTPRRVIWVGEERPRFHAYPGARPFRARADEMLRKVFEMAPRPEAHAPDAETDAFDEARLVARLDLLRANEWPGEVGRNPFEPIVEIWRLGYGMSAVVDEGVVLLARGSRNREA